MPLQKAPPVFRCRASGLGQLMTEPRAKKDKENGELSATAKSFLTLWYKEQLYDRRKPIESKYITKGNECEDSSIKMMNKSWTNNKEQFENDWLTGEPDVITKTEIIDLKNSWDFTTFPLFSTTCPKEDYNWQVLAYMWMCNKKKGRVIYTLMDIPEHLIQREIGSNVPLTDELMKDFKYEHLPKKLRVKEFKVPYDEEKIEQIKQKVEKAREFIRAISI